MAETAIKRNWLLIPFQKRTNWRQNEGLQPEVHDVVTEKRGRVECHTTFAAQYMRDRTGYVYIVSVDQRKQFVRHLSGPFVPITAELVPQHRILRLCPGNQCENYKDQIEYPDSHQNLRRYCI